jgi:hypothetical protein
MKIRILLFITILIIIISLYIINFFIPLIGFIPESLIITLINIITYLMSILSLILETLNDYLGGSIKDDVKDINIEKLDKRKLLIISTILIALLIIVNLHNNNWDLYNHIQDLTDLNTFLEDRLNNTSDLLETTLDQNNRFIKILDKIIDIK